ncbi:MAG: ABC transporter permease [Saccharofermentanales bacterium]
MGKYLSTRVIYSFLALLLLAALTFFMMQALPGDPFLKEKKLPASVEANLRAKFGLDKSKGEQFIIYMKNIASGDFGYSFESKRPTADVISRGIPYSFELGIRSIIVAVVFGLLLGITAALNAGKTKDSVTMILAILGVSMPSFVIGYLMQYYLAFGFSTVFREWTGVQQLFPITGWKDEASKILPVLALAFGTMAQISRLMRSSMLDVISSDYIKTARAKGLSQGSIIRHHMLRNSILPIITILGPLTASVMTGSFVIESIFGVPGIGRLFVTSVQTRDYTVIMGVTMFYGAFLILMNMLVDIAYGFVDPRIRLAK